MNIEKLARQALSIIKTKDINLPNTGVIAGGSLANVIWELISGKKAVINDIDVFILKNVLTEKLHDGTTTQDRKKIFYRSQEKIYWKDYTGLCEGSKTKNFYLIENTENIGLLNLVYYSATSEDPELIIDSFDINCTQIAYDITSDKFYWTQEFVDFLKTGKLKLTNLGSPHHSAIRIIKKRDDLGAILNEEELKIAAYTVCKNFNGITRRYFSDKYFHIFKKYEKELSKYFEIVQEKEISSLIKESKNVDIGIFTLRTISDSNSILTDDELKDQESKMWHVNDFLFFFRNVKNDSEQRKIWSKVQPLFTYSNYVDTIPVDQDLELLSRIIENIPSAIKHLYGLKISEQIKLVKKLIEEFSDDVTVAFALLEHKKLENDLNFDSQTKLLLELSVRTNIVNNNYDVNKILYGKPSNVNDRTQDSGQWMSLPF